MSLVTQINNALIRIGTEFKTVSGRIGTLASLSTTAKGSLVEAINEVKSTAGAQINDAAAATTSVYSSTQTETRITAAVNSLVDSAPGTLDTLNELAAALGDDPNAIATINTALGNRVRFDAAQTLTAPQQVQARTNIGAASAVDVGDTTADFTATFVAALA